MWWLFQEFLELFYFLILLDMVIHDLYELYILIKKNKTLAWLRDCNVLFFSENNM